MIDVTEYLPSELQSPFLQTQEILECIVVNSSSSPEFATSSRKCERDPAVVSARVGLILCVDLTGRI